MFKYKSITMNDTKHDYSITVKVTETYTRHQTVPPTLKCDNWNILISEANYTHKRVQLSQ